MRTSKVGEDVWRFDGDSSVYLIRQEDGWILIDAGNEIDKEELGKAISEVVPLGRIDAVLLTHLHYDHIGCLDLFSNAEVFVGDIELEDYVDNARRFHFYVNERVDKILSKAKEFGPECFGLSVFNVPGHTRGSIIFVDKKRRLVFSGDSVFGRGIIGRTDFANSVSEEMDKSVAKIWDLINAGYVLCPGHDYC